MAQPCRFVLQNYLISKRFYKHNGSELRLSILELHVNSKNTLRPMGCLKYTALGSLFACVRCIPTTETYLTFVGESSFRIFCTIAGLNFEGRDDPTSQCLVGYF